MHHTAFWTAAWILVAAKLLSTLVAVLMKRTGYVKARYYMPVYVATKATPPAFVACFLADALFIHDASGVRFYMVLLAAVIVLLAVVFYLKVRFGFEGLVKARARS